MLGRDSMKKNLMVIAIEQNPEFTLEELCRACGILPEKIIEMMEYGVIEPRGYDMENWRFEAQHLRRVRTILHLQRDLEINLAGAALVLDLMDERNKLRERLEFFEKYFG